MDFPRLHIVIVVDCSSSINEYKLKLLNKAILDLFIFLNNFSREHSLDPYIGIIQFSESAAWLTYPEIIPFSSFHFQEIKVIRGVAHPSSAFHLLKPVIEKINRAFPPQHWDWVVDANGSFQELPVVFLLSEGNFHETRENIRKTINETIRGKCICIPIIISNILPEPDIRAMWTFSRLGKNESDDSLHRIEESEKDYNFSLLDEFRPDSFYYGQPFIEPIHVLELERLNQFFMIPFKRQTARDE
ncbi:MAG: VWA domain-containing protein [Methanoregula sp.]|nr:VWA domain-containing protein [Methanoregula sp.]